MHLGPNVSSSAHDSGCVVNGSGAIYGSNISIIIITGLGIQLSSGKTVGGMLFADDFVGISDSKESLQKLLDVVYSYCSKWRLRANTHRFHPLATPTSC